MCGMEIGLGSIPNFDHCLDVGPNINNYMACLDPSIHGPPHSIVGGSWKRESQLPFQDSPSCSQWYGYIPPPEFPANYTKPKGWVRGSYIHPVAAGCFTCKKCSNFNYESLDECMCSVNSKRCGPLWSNLPNEKWAKVKLTKAKNIQILGDFTDPLSSPNDPIFAFHHANVDRHFDNWIKINRRYHNKHKNYFNFPSKGYAQGSNLNDLITKSHPFHDLVNRIFGKPDRGFHSIKTILKKAIEQDFPYEYDRQYFEGVEIEIENFNSQRKLISSSGNIVILIFGFIIGSYLIRIVLFILAALVIYILHFFNILPFDSITDDQTAENTMVTNRNEIQQNTENYHPLYSISDMKNDETV